MAFQGDVKTIALREVLGWLADKRATGILSLSRGLVVRQFHLRLGTILTRTGVVSKEALRDVLREKSRRLLQDVLGWSEGAFFFDAAAVPKRPTVAASVSLAEILKEPAGGALAPAVRDDVVVGDDDIVEVTELANPRRTAGSAEFDAAFTAAEAAWLTRTN
jgi:hypothetical protein